MDLGIIENVVNGIGLRLLGASDALVPVGQSVAYSLSIVAIVMTAAGLLTGSFSAIAPLIFNLCLGIAATLWLLAIWPGLPLELVHDARTMVGLVTGGGGYAGPTQLFDLAAHVYGRIAAEPIGWSLSAGALAQAIGLVIAGPLCLFGLCYVGLLAVLAEVSLLLGGVCAPIVVCLIALPFTRPLGIGALQWIFGQMVRCTILGVVATVMAQVISDQLVITGTDAGLTTEQIAALLLTSALTFLVGHSANSIAGALVSGSTLGMSSWSASTNAASSIASSVGGAAVSTGSAVAAGASKVRSAGEAARSMPSVSRSSGSGSPW